jgi:hypothetical protein
MSSEEIYDDIQEVKTAIVITFLVAVYCISVIFESIAVHIEWKVICASVGFIIVAAIDARLLFRLLWLQKESKNIVNNSN